PPSTGSPQIRKRLGLSAHGSVHSHNANAPWTAIKAASWESTVSPMTSKAVVSSAPMRAPTFQRTGSLPLPRSTRAISLSLSLFCRDQSPPTTPPPDDEDPIRDQTTQIFEELGR